MNLKIKALLVCMSVILVSVLTGCNREKVYKIGVSQCSEDDWRAKMNEEINREIMYHEDASVEIRSANDDSEKQISDIRYFMENKFDIIIVAPNEAAELTPIVREVYEKGIPVIIFDRNIVGDSYTARISVDNEGLGRAAAQYALHLCNRGAKALEIYGLHGSTPADERHKGFVAEFEKGGGKLLSSAAGDWNQEDAVRVCDSLLDIYDDVDLIYAHNDRMAIGASEVARRKGREDIKIIGIDAAPNVGIIAVRDSVIDATFLYPTEGYRLIRTALAILKGEKYEREVVIPSSSAVDLTNADILLLQDETLRAETSKMIYLKQQIDSYWAQHSSQTSLFYACIVIIFLLCGVVFLVLRAYWQHKRHQEVLMKKNQLLQEQRDKQKELNTRLEEATQSKLVFFTNVSHDLRTPLTLISEPVAQLSEAENLSGHQKTLVKIANKNVKILQRLINQILDFRKYENGKLSLNLSEVRIGDAVRSWIEAFYGIARKRDMKLRLVEPESEPLSLALDAEKMERVFFNLLSNAFKYTPDNGSITISYTYDDKSLTLNVEDSGRGIAERDLGNIFDRFYQVDKVHPNGSGIGLSLTKAFVELHGGHITVESELGKGSIFTVQIPITHVESELSVAVPTINEADVEAELEEVEAEVTFDSQKPLVLIIDDNEDMRKLVTTLLSESYSTITASNGREGIRKATKYVPDLIICDVMMPVMDGLECCRQLKKEITTSHIPVLMLTACSMDEQRVQCYDSGCDGYVSKPFNSMVLLSRCASLIENRKRIKELWQSPVAVSVNQREEVRNSEPSDIDNDFYVRFLKIFREEMGNIELSVDSMAGKMGLERSQFYRKIKSLTNYSPVELIRHLRLKEGRALLTSTDKTVSEIAYEIGFSSPAYFTKCYREEYGETPKETRNRE